VTLNLNPLIEFRSESTETISYDFGGQIFEFLWSNTISKEYRFHFLDQKDKYLRKNDKTKMPVGNVNLIPICKNCANYTHKLLNISNMTNPLEAAADVRLVPVSVPASNAISLPTFWTRGCKSCVRPQAAT
jgi:hypothetical protein